MKRSFSSVQTARLTALTSSALIAAAFAIWACGNKEEESPFPSETTTSDAGSDSTSPGAFETDGSVESNSGTFTDFPTPIVDMGAPANAAEIFGATPAGTAAAPCLSEPEIGALYPRNWLRPRFTFTAPGATLFEIRLEIENQTAPLIVYTTSTAWKMPAETWNLLRTHSWNKKITVKVRGGTLNGTTLSNATASAEGEIGIAPVEAPGAIVYWAISSGYDASLKGFAVGEETVHQALTPANVKTRAVTCVGCHTAAPGGQYALFATRNDTGGAGPMRWESGALDPKIDGGIGTPLPFIHANAAAKFANEQTGISTVSPAHWSAGDHVIVSTFAEKTFDAVNLDTGVSTTIARTGDIDGNLAIAPSFAHDGSKIAYMSTKNDVIHMGNKWVGPSDLYTVPYNGGAGGAATPIAGASLPDKSEYYPSFSPDDAFVAFTRVDGNSVMYNSVDAEVFVVPSAGGTATRLKANDPPACSNKKSPGITNSWPKWAPSAGQYGQTKYYFLVFSSTRSASTRPQLYVTPIAVAADGSITTYAALYLWNQLEAEGNHTPSWDYYTISNSLPN